MLSTAPDGGPGSGSTAACSGGWLQPTSSFGPPSGEVASPSSSPLEPSSSSGGFIRDLTAVVLRTCLLDQALISWPAGRAGGVDPGPVSDSDSLVVDRLLELDSSPGTAAALRSGFGGGGLISRRPRSWPAGLALEVLFAASALLAGGVEPTTSATAGTWEGAWEGSADLDHCRTVAWVSDPEGLAGLSGGPSGSGVASEACWRAEVTEPMEKPF